MRTQKQHIAQNAEHPTLASPRCPSARATWRNAPRTSTTARCRYNSLASGTDKLHSRTPETEAQLEALKLQVRMAEQQGDEDAQIANDKKLKVDSAIPATAVLLSCVRPRRELRAARARWARLGPRRLAAGQ